MDHRPNHTSWIKLLEENIGVKFSGPWIRLWFFLDMTPKAQQLKKKYIRYCKIEDQNYFRMLPHYNEDQIFQSSSFALQCSNMIHTLCRIISGLSEPADDDGVGQKAILSYFRKIYIKCFFDGYICL